MIRGDTFNVKTAFFNVENTNVFVSITKNKNNLQF